MYARVRIQIKCCGKFRDRIYPALGLARAFAACPPAAVLTYCLIQRISPAVIGQS